MNRNNLGSLNDLFLSLFADDQELELFLHYHKISDIRRNLNLKQGFQFFVYEVVERLDKHEQIDKALFHALTKAFPSRAQDVKDVANQLEIDLQSKLEILSQSTFDIDLQSTDTVETDIVQLALTDDERRLLDNLNADLEAVESLDPVEIYLSGERWPWTAAAAVLGAFRALMLKPLPDSPYSNIVGDSIHHLVDAVEVRWDGFWVLQDEIRERALSKLIDDSQLAEAISANNELADTRRDLLACATGNSDVSLPPLTHLDTEQLTDVDTVAAWLEPIDAGYLDRKSIAVALARRTLIDPLRSLVGKHFRGRNNEMTKIWDTIESPDENQTLIIWGPGGVGKSSLIGKVILDLESHLSERTAYVYLDFDRARHNPRKPRSLLEAIFEQLKLLFAHVQETSELFSGLEGMSSGSRIFGSSRDFENLSETDTDEELVKRLAELLPNEPNLILVLDTFEEVQIHGPGVVKRVVDLVKLLRKYLPDMRLIVSGRAPVPELSLGDSNVLLLGDLDEEAADAVLKHFDVQPGTLREQIVQKFGSNPLTLKLAAEAISGIGNAHTAFEEFEHSDVMTSIATEQIQGMLYKRILGHISDTEVVKVAHPGLVVRRVTPTILEQVLAVPCDLETTNFDKLFDRLRREVSLFHIDTDGALVHRQDVRKIMLLSMNDDPVRRDKVQQIHNRAIEYYSNGNDNLALAEELYHRLMLDEEPRSLDSLWKNDLRTHLSNALDECLPPRARIWLSARLGNITQEERTDLEQEDWEQDAYRRAKSWLDSGEPDRALEVCDERNFRLPGSSLHEITISSYIALNKLQKAKKELNLSLEEAVEYNLRNHHLNLRMLSIELAIASNKTADLLQAVDGVINLAALTNRPEDAFRALVKAAEFLRSNSSSVEFIEISNELQNYMNQLDNKLLTINSDLVARAIRAAGVDSPEIIVRAAQVFGNLSATDNKVFRSDIFGIKRLLENSGSENSPKLKQLAIEAGMPTQGWSMQNLASEISRKGLLGKTLIMALDTSTAKQEIGQQIVGTLISKVQDNDIL